MKEFSLKFNCNFTAQFIGFEFDWLYKSPDVIKGLAFSDTWIQKIHTWKLWPTKNWAAHRGVSTYQSARFFFPPQFRGRQPNTWRKQKAGQEDQSYVIQRLYATSMRRSVSVNHKVGTGPFRALSYNSFQEEHGWLDRCFMVVMNHRGASVTEVAQMVAQG